jgi:hypothetical protein
MRSYGLLACRPFFVWPLTACLLAGSLMPACRKASPPSTRTNAAIADSTLGTPAADSEAQSAVLFAQGFYGWYARHGDRYEAAVRDSPSFFAPVLLEAMRADIAAQARRPGEIVGLDWDPFLATQDPCDPYRVGRAARRGDTILVAVKGMCTDMQPRTGPDAIAELGRSKRRWVFVDFRHGGDSGSLLQDLAALRQGRASDSARK